MMIILRSGRRAWDAGRTDPRMVLEVGQKFKAKVKLGDNDNTDEQPVECTLCAEIVNPQKGTVHAVVLSKEQE